MKIPSEVKPALWGAVGGAVALAIIGFSWGGWVTGGTAQAMATKEADRAVVTVLAPICVEKFQQQPDAHARMAAFQEVTSYKRAAYIEEGGWATMAGAEKPYSGTARACAEMIGKLQQ